MDIENNLLKYLLENITIENVIKFFVLYFLVIWIFLLIWVGKDISNRTQNIFFQIISVLIVFIFTPLGIFLYLIIRPSKTLFDQYSEEIENNLDCLNSEIKEKIGKKNFEFIDCPKCNKKIEKEFRFCPHCKIKLKKQCNKCSELLEIDWDKCPYCGDEKNKKSKKNKKSSNI